MSMSATSVPSRKPVLKALADGRAGEIELETEPEPAGTDDVGDGELEQLAEGDQGDEDASVDSNATLSDHLCNIGQGAIAWVFLPGTCAHFGRAVSLFYLPRRSANSFIKSPSLHRC